MNRIREFVFKLFVFLAPLLLVGGFVEWKLAAVPNSYNQKKIDFEKSLTDIEVLSLGNSEALYAINPSYFSYKGFNLANISQTIYYDKRLCLKYLDRMPKLKLVIIQVSYTTFFHQLADTKENWRDYYYNRYWGIKYKELPLIDSKYFSFISLYSIPEVLKLVGNGFHSNAVDNLSENGFMKNDTTNRFQHINDSLGKLRVMMHDSGMLVSRIPEVTNDLADLMTALESRGIKFVVITTPVCTTYSKFCKPSILSKNKSLVDSLCAKYNCRYQSYFTDGRFSANDFTDNDHMNFLGAARFTKILNEELVVPLLTGVLQKSEIVQ